jgi:hypothetical protein
MLVSILLPLNEDEERETNPNLLRMVSILYLLDQLAYGDRYILSCRHRSTQCRARAKSLQLNVRAGMASA